MSVLGDLSMEDLAALRRMSKADAIMFLSRHKLTEDEYPRALALAEKDFKVSKIDHWATRRTWLTSAFLLGASFRQLGRLHGVAPQTIFSLVDRMMPAEEREAKRLSNKLSHEQLSEHFTTFNKSIERLSDLGPLEVAQWLLDNTEVDK